MMNRSRTQIAVFGVLALLGMSGAASGQCIVDETTLEDIGATSVLDASGHGNFTCDDMSPGPDGGTMEEMLSGVKIEVYVDEAVPKVDVTVTSPVIDPVTGKSRELDAVYIKPKGNGARCLYTFTNYSESAAGLQAGGDDFTEDDVVVCVDGGGTPPPEEPAIVEPISTIGDGCEGTIFVNNQALLGDQAVAVVSAVSLDGQTLAVCSGDDGVENTVTPQFQCVNVCENFEARAESAACVAANAARIASDTLQEGELDLEACRPCDRTDLENPPAWDENEPPNPVFYCWEYTNSAVKYDNDPIYGDPGVAEFIPGTFTPRSPGTMLPHKQAWSASEETEIFNGCYKKTVYLNGRAYTYTTCY